MPLELVTKPTITADFSKFASDERKIDWSVSRQWASRPADQRYRNKDELLSYLRGRTLAAEAHDVALADLRPMLNADGEMSFEHNGKLLVPTNYSFSQIGDAIGMPTGFFRSTLANRPDLVVECLREGIDRLDDDEKQVQLWRSGLDVRGVTSPSYGRVLDYDVAVALWTAIEDSGTQWEVPTAFALPGATKYPCVDPTKEETTLYASDRDICLFLVDQRNPIECGFITDPVTGGRVPDIYSRGIVVRNGECGGVALSISTFLYRWCCSNRSIRDQKGWQQVTMAHRAGAMDAFVSKMVPAMRSFVNGSTAGIADGLQAAKNARLCRSDEDRLDILRGRLGFEFSEAAANAVMQKCIDEEGHPIETKWDAVQAITAWARSLDHQDARMDVERRVSKKLLEAV